LRRSEGEKVREIEDEKVRGEEGRNQESEVRSLRSGEERRADG